MLLKVHSTAAWRDAVLASGNKGTNEHRRTWEMATLLALRDRLRAGDIWMEGSRQWRIRSGDVTIRRGELNVMPLKAVTPEAAEAAADRLYSATPGSACKFHRRIHAPRLHMWSAKHPEVRYEP